MKMSTSYRQRAGHQAQVPGRIAEYFQAHHPDVEEHPVITAEYRTGRGWRPQVYRKRVSLSWLRKLKSEGVTAVQVTAGGFSPDFQIDEIIRYANRPLLGGRLI
jgi:hypothetical protein